MIFGQSDRQKIILKLFCKDLNKISQHTSPINTILERNPFEKKEKI